MTYDNNDVSHIFLNSDKSIESVPNTLDITWKYREKDTENWIEGGTLSPVIDKNKNTYENEESLGTIFDYTKQYDFMFYCVDKINNIVIEDKVQRGFPVFWWNSKDVYFNGDIRLKGDLYVNDNMPYCYSTEEQVIGKWIDGKPIYRNVSNVTLQNTSRWTNLINIPNLDKLINVYGFCGNITIPRYESSSYYTQFLFENNYLKYMANGNSGSAFIVTEYTKTTDEEVNNV